MHDSYGNISKLIQSFRSWQEFLLTCGHPKNELLTLNYMMNAKVLVFRVSNLGCALFNFNRMLRVCCLA